MAGHVEETELAARAVERFTDARDVSRREVDDREAFGRTSQRRRQWFLISPVMPATKIALSNHPAMICIQR